MLHEALGTTTTNRPQDLQHRHIESFRPITALPDGMAKGGLAGWQLRKVVQHIEDNLAGPLSCHDLAAAARLSTGHFCRAFKTSMGEPPHAYVIRQRIRRAQRLMLQTDDALSEIACICGLTDQAHLTRLFRRMVGTTPKVWRNRWKPLNLPG
jgi:transcriptional regulator GlxA family with amidase domain